MEKVPFSCGNELIYMILGKSNSIATAIELNYEDLVSISFSHQITIRVLKR